MLALPKRDIVISKARRQNVPLLFGIFAIWDGGKTVSGIRIGRGMAKVLAGDPDQLYVIDTEGNRALAYADQYAFNHVPLVPPHGSLDYLATILHCVNKGARVIMVDTVTHEHYGIGGYLDTIASEQERLAALWKLSKPEGAKWAATNVAASRRKELVRHVEQLGKEGVAIIFCFRASEKIRIPKKGAKNDQGEREVVEMGYMPDTKESLMFLMTASALLMPRAKGVPTWRSEKPGESLMIKLPSYFEGIFRDGEQLNETHGEVMAKWAHGDDDGVSNSKPLNERLAECLAFLSKVEKSALLRARYKRSEIVALRRELDDEGRLKLDEKYDELLSSLEEREAIEAESRS